MARTFAQHAWWTFGPIDLVITATINAACPFLFLKWNDTVGIPILAAFLLPMAFFVGLIPTFFGYRNGVLMRSYGLGNGPLQDGIAWQRVALRDGVVAVLIAELGFVVILGGMYCFAPHQRWTVPNLALADGFLSGFLAYFLHSTAMLRAGSLKA